MDTNVAVRLHKAAGDLAILLLLARSQSRHRNPDFVSKPGRILCAGLDCGLPSPVHLRCCPVHCVSGFNHRSHLSHVRRQHRNHGAIIQDRLVGIEPVKGAQRPGASLQPRVFDQWIFSRSEPGNGMRTRAGRPARAGRSSGLLLDLLRLLLLADLDLTWAHGFGDLTDEIDG